MILSPPAADGGGKLRGGRAVELFKPTRAAEHGPSALRGQLLVVVVLRPALLPLLLLLLLVLLQQVLVGGPRAARRALPLRAMLAHGDGPGVPAAGAGGARAGARPGRAGLPAAARGLGAG
eukprot:CAMPEP_0179296198 /NCGR_PEP_ID=MMETSP0797-20121207/44815_1 /TAXON_ID=47934 /ORGANISM="Dinophysis acuminata, Strain DAEP01" /LENGTH=120 /DNA_ID=CAMNT_0021005469 /DNA_START=45 /DNA_END=405 /DNA_ORIENTATION=-